MVTNACMKSFVTDYQKLTTLLLMQKYCNVSTGLDSIYIENILGDQSW